MRCDGLAYSARCASGSVSAWATFSLVSDGRPATENLHIAFPATDRETVVRFHETATAAGYRDNGAPGERLQYHRGYYGAFVRDPDGHNVEAVCHDPYLD